MARGQKQSVGAITVAMIAFAALWLTSTVFLVVLYTGQEELKSDMERAQRDVRRLISPSERSSISLVQNASESGPTVVGLLESARRDVAQLATGNPDDDVATVRAGRDAVLDAITRDGSVTDADRFENASLLEALTMLNEAHKTLAGLYAKAQQTGTRLDEEVTDLTERVEAQKVDFEQRASELSVQLAEVETGRTKYRTERDGAVQRIQEQFEAAEAQSTAELTHERQKTARLERDLTELRKRFAAREEKFGELLMGPEAMATARQPDGMILTAIPGDTVVYIDLGRDDRLALGLQFAVYPAAAGIPADGRAKAQIEVVAIMDTSAECKVVALARNEVLLEGDLIANPIYDPTRPQTFLVAGEFDLDSDGTPDPRGAAVMESMIKDWGGVLTTELTAQTDFVVLGAAPRKPRARGDTSAESSGQYSVAQRAWERYMDTLRSAKALSIPIMTQEVFLNFLGYRGRVALR